MKGAVLYFSGTGNTEFAARQFKKQFEEHGFECVLFDISKKRSITDNYDLYVFGCPIYWGSFTDYFVEWVRKNTGKGNQRKCIVLSTYSREPGIGAVELSRILSEKEFEVLIKYALKMPDNSGFFSSKGPTGEEIKELKDKVLESVEEIVKAFINGKKIDMTLSDEKILAQMKKFKTFEESSGIWAEKNLKADMNTCVKCGKCAKNCPTHNISLGEFIKFKDKCICCRKCVLGCPVNALKKSDEE